MIALHNQTGITLYSLFYVRSSPFGCMYCVASHHEVDWI